MVALGPTGVGRPDDALCVYNAAGTINVLVDVNGWYGSTTATATPPGYQYQALGPTRICDTRVASTSCATGAIGAGTALERLITVAGHGGVPAFGTGPPVVAIIANLTAITPTATTYLTLFPANLAGPGGVSDLNVGARAVVPQTSSWWKSTRSRVIRRMATSTCTTVPAASTRSLISRAGSSSRPALIGAGCRHSPANSIVSTV